ncbi:MAG: DUF4149 domain-containing protein [Burkholderiales bacterium]|nr:DUF4149 domain-containing protein [Burkholderiales bacterium]MCH2240683.1 DUF4149 domain-containing protein [Aquabacterium sp.]
MLLRIRALAAGLWAGMLLSIGGLAAPTLFAMLDRAAAGRVAGRYFWLEARASIVLAVLLIVIERWLVRRHDEADLAAPARQFTVELMLVLGALLCTIVGFEIIQPLMEQARAGQGGWSFASLHAVSSGFFAAKIVLVAILAWRCCGRR